MVDVLVIEDDPALVDVITRNLAARGYAARSAASVADALIALSAGCPPLILLDVDLPDGSGWEVLRTLRQQGCRDTKPIVITGLRPNQRLVRDLECAAVLEKPFPIEALLRLVTGSLSGVRGQASEPPSKRSAS